MTTGTGKNTGTLNTNQRKVFEYVIKDIDFDKMSIIYQAVYNDPPICYAKETLYTYKIWNIKEERYVENGNYGRANYDCYPKSAVKQIAGRLCGPGNYEIHKFKLERVE